MLLPVRRSHLFHRSAVRFRRGVEVGLLLLLLLLLTASTTLAACGRAFIDPATGRDTPSCGDAGQPCRSLAFARQRAAGCDSVTRIFRLQNNLMTLADVVIPAQSTGDHRTPEWLRPVFPFFGLFLKPEEYLFPPITRIR